MTTRVLLAYKYMFCFIIILFFSLHFMLWLKCYLFNSFSTNTIMCSKPITADEKNMCPISYARVEEKRFVQGNSRTKIKIEYMKLTANGINHKTKYGLQFAFSEIVRHRLELFIICMNFLKKRNKYFRFFLNLNTNCAT